MSAASTIRTRFAPSPTGYLHLGGARTALFCWAYARRYQGMFILRIEDTDLERSTPEAVKAILDGMEWLGLNYDEGPFYQMQRMARYQAVIAQMLQQGTAYYCYATPAEVEAMRERQRLAGQKPRYDGLWRPEPDKQLPAVPPDCKPVVRFKNPTDGNVAWCDLVKGMITIANAELDDLVIARSDGTPTYNFCVVVDDWDMQITHVLRGDDHVNNTPRQINILQALGATLPQYGHLPMILGPDGEKLSKRHGAVSVMEYCAEGYLPEAVLNALARLGWGHGNDEVFTLEQFCVWFELDHLSKSPAQFNPEKLRWLNNHYLKAADNQRLIQLLQPIFAQQQISLQPAAQDIAPLEQIIAAVKERAHTLPELAKLIALFYQIPELAPEKIAGHLSSGVLRALHEFIDQCRTIEWEQSGISRVLKQLLAAHQLKMPQLAMPLRLALTGQLQTPSIDLVITLLGRSTTLQRLQNNLPTSIDA